MVGRARKMKIARFFRSNFPVNSFHLDFHRISRHFINSLEIEISAVLKQEERKPMEKYFYSLNISCSALRSEVNLL